ncbi:beta-phosphoglucomutase [Robertkochia aurantiaca]|uniref:beta-phosphoglucomutase n=1 Tax=Robertkochia aurantiaca TaxID=2873700 RepID=UPI001CCD9347|nr:beta-phosphoglucomutase [Robertkochia sp. 3YJGBD-33]
MKGLIFDLDGVIVDTARFHFLAWSKTAEELGYELTEEKNEELKGVSRIDSLKKILSWAGTTIEDEQFRKMTAEKNEDYLSYVDKMTTDDILPGVYDLIADLKAKGYPIALGSASKNAPRILKKTGMYEMFDAIVDGNSVSKAKPDPEVFLVAAEAIQVAPENCVVFEDSSAGVTAAKRAGMIAIGIGDQQVLGHADFVFPDLKEMSVNFIENLENKAK